MSEHKRTRSATEYSFSNASFCRMFPNHAEVSRSSSAQEIGSFTDITSTGLYFEITKCCGNNRVCIKLTDNDKTCDRPCCSSDIIVQTSTKDECRIRQCDIIYIAIENRKSVVYVDGRRIETNYSLEHWKEILNPKIFAQPHSSFLVNLCYVEEVTKDFVKIKHKGKDYFVYTSSRKLVSFKRAFLEHNK